MEMVAGEFVFSTCCETDEGFDFPSRLTLRTKCPILCRIRLSVTFFGPFFFKHIYSTMKHQFFLARSVKVGVFARGCKQMAKNSGDIEAVHMDMELM